MYLDLESSKKVPVPIRRKELDPQNRPKALQLCGLPTCPRLQDRFGENGSSNCRRAKDMVRGAFFCAFAGQHRGPSLVRWTWRDTASAQRLPQEAWGDTAASWSCSGNCGNWEVRSTGRTPKPTTSNSDFEGLRVYKEDSRTTVTNFGLLLGLKYQIAWSWHIWEDWRVNELCLSGWIFLVVGSSTVASFSRRSSPQKQTWIRSRITTY